MSKNNENYVDPTIGKKLKELRAERNMSMREVGEEIGINYTYISKIEKGQIPSMKLLNDLCKVYGVEVKDLYGESQPVPEELREIGVEWISFAKEMEKENLTPERIKRYIDVIKRLKQDM